MQIVRAVDIKNTFPVMHPSIKLEVCASVSFFFFCAELGNLVLSTVVCRAGKLQLQHSGVAEKPFVQASHVVYCFTAGLSCQLNMGPCNKH